MKIVHTQRMDTPPYAEHVIFFWSDLNHVMKRIINGLPSPANSFLEALILFVKYKECDAIVTAGHKTSFFFGLFNRLAKQMRTHVVKDIYIPDNVLHSPIKTMLFRWALRRTTLVIVHSANEVAVISRWLKIRQDKIKFIPWASPFGIQEVDMNRESGNYGTSYVLSAGSSFRDWETLFKAIRGSGINTVVVAREKDVVGLDVPPEVTLYYDISHEHYLRLLRDSSIVVVPLHKTERSIGQTVLVEAMTYGKPIICTKVSGTLDYVDDGITGIFYEPYNHEELKMYITKLYHDDSLRKVLSENAFRKAQAMFSKEHYSTEMLNIMKRTCEMLTTRIG